MYMLFMQKFLATKQYHPFLHKLYHAGVTFCLSFPQLFIAMPIISRDNYVLENRIENITKILAAGDGCHFPGVQHPVLE